MVPTNPDIHRLTGLSGPILRPSAAVGNPGPRHGDCRFDQAADWAEKAIPSLPNWSMALGIAAASFALSGRQGEAQRAVARLRELNLVVGAFAIVSAVPFRRHEDVAIWAEGLLRAGLPE